MEGNTTKSAISKGLKKLDLEEKDVKTEILRKEEKGIFGIGNKQLAKVRIFYKEKTELSLIFNNINKIISFIDENATTDFENHGERYLLKIDSKMPEQFIGRNGKTQNSIQMLINALIQKYNNSFKIVVDVNNYTKKKNNNFVKWISEQAQSVKRSGKPVILKPMNSYQRRIIHLEIKKYPELKSESRGISKLKSIKISLVNPSSSQRSANNANHRNSRNVERSIEEEQKKFASDNEMKQQN